MKSAETKKKQKSLPKLKTILADPFKARCPTLGEDDLQQLEGFINKDISNCGLEKHTFATAKEFHLGLESSLRAIKNCQSSCVLLSLSIKPRFLINLIARNSEVKDETVPVFVQPKLEDFTERVFAVKALSLVLPPISRLKDLGVNAKLLEWLKNKQKPKRIRNQDTGQCLRLNKPKKTLPLQRTDLIKQEESIVKNTKGEKKETKTEAHSFMGDYISFGSSSEGVTFDKLKLEDEDSTLKAALSTMTKNIVKEDKNADKFKMDVDVETNMLNQPNENDAQISSDTDEFLSMCEYQPLRVRKICPNPERKSKKKRNKKNVKK